MIYLNKDGTGGTIAGPIELAQPSLSSVEALSHMGDVYQSLMERCPSLINPHYPTLDSLPTHSCRGSVLRLLEGTISVTMGMPLYSITMKYHYTDWCGWYDCYSHLDNHLYVPLASLHHIYGVGSMLSGVEMVVNYCEESAHKYIRCPRCKYSNNNASYCGQGLEMHTDQCGYMVPRD